MNISRRGLFAILSGLVSERIISAAAAESISPQRLNFHYIYDRPELRRTFLDFLTNVFHLYPVQEMDALIARHVAGGADDKAIYRLCQQQLAAITPTLADLRYALPALNKQKAVLGQQTRQLLGEPSRLEGYLEFGSGGRYLDSLEENLPLSGPRFFVHDRPVGYSLSDMIDRGQVLQAGMTLPFNHYRPSLSTHIPAATLDLVTVYIGFHHCPVPLRNEFLQDIRHVMRPGAALVVRDHQAHDDDMWHMIALAHDVFNLGTRENWEYNEAELRNFYSLEFLDGMLKANGFSGSGDRLFQPGDPTKNALMLYRKV